MSWLGKLGLGFGHRAMDSSSSSIAQGPDDDVPAPGQQFAQFGAGCFWGVELAFQRVAGVTKTEVGYSQGFFHNPTYNDVCSGTTNHSEIVRVQFDPNHCTYHNLLEAFWARHDPTTLNRQVIQLTIRFSNSLSSSFLRIGGFLGCFLFVWMRCWKCFNVVSKVLEAFYLGESRVISSSSEVFSVFCLYCLVK